MSRYPRLITLALLIAGACACALAAPADEKEAVHSRLDRDLFYEILLGELSARGGDALSAYALILDAAHKANDSRLYERAVDMALMARSGDAALQAAQAWAQAFPSSRDANRYLLQILIGMNRLADVLEPLQKDLASYSDKEKNAAISLLPRYFARASDKAAAVSVAEQALSQALAHPATASTAWAAIGNMRLAAGRPAAALVAAQRGAQTSPLSEDIAALALNLMDPKLPDAEVLVQKCLALQPTPDLRMAYARKLLDTQRYAEAYAQMVALTRERPEFADAWLVRGSLEVQEKRLAVGEASLQTYLTLSQPPASTAEAPPMGRGQIQAYLLLAQVAEQNQKLDEAIAYLDRVNSPQDALRVQTRRAMLVARQGKLEEARALIRSLPEAQPEDARTKFNAELQLLREYKLYAPAYQLLGEALVRDPQDMDLVYDQAMAAEKIGKLDEMERLLRRIISSKPDYHAAYNALGYSMADRNERLPEARQLIQKALSFAPNDPYMVDSLAWVEFRSGNFNEALRLLQSAYQARPDAEIAAHLGEVLWTLGQRSQAQDIWRQGMELNPANDTLLETMHRFKPQP